MLPTSRNSVGCLTPPTADAIRQAKQARDLKDVLRSGSAYNSDSSLSPIARSRTCSSGVIDMDSGKENWCSTVGLLGTGQIFGEICVLNPKVPSDICGIAYTKVVS